MAEEFGGETFFPSPFISVAPDTLIRERKCILVDIEARPQVSHLVINHSPDVPINPDSLNDALWFCHMAISGGSATLTVSATPTQFSTMTDHYVSSDYPPSYLIFIDETSGTKYWWLDPSTGAENISSTKPMFSVDNFQYVGDYLEFIGDDGISIVRLTVLSNDTSVKTIDRVESLRNQAIRISHGHPFPYDGVNLYDESLIEFGNVSTRIPQSETGFGGVVIPRVSNLKIQNHTGKWSFLAHQSWDSRTVTARIGNINEEISTYPIAFRGQTERCESDLNEIRVTLRDASVLLNKSMQENSYTGLGGLEGGGDVEGRKKPLVYGRAHHLVPILLSTADNLYQVHDGPVHSISHVTEGGIPRPSLGTITSRGLSSILDWVPTASDISQAGFLTDPSNGLFRLATTPSGIITASTTQGASTDIISPFTPSDVIRGIIQAKLPTLNIDGDSFDKFKSDIFSPSGIVVEEDESILQAFDKFLRPLASVLIVDNQNNVFIKKLRTSEAKIGIIGDNNTLENSRLILRQAKKPGSSYRFGFSKVEAQITQTDLLDDAPNDYKEVMVNRYRYKTFKVTESPNTRLPLYESSKSITRESTTTSIAPYTARVSEEPVLAWLQDYTLQNILEVTLFGVEFSIEIGDTVLVKHSLLNLGNIRSGIVVGVSEHDPTGVREGATDLMIWI